MRTNIDLDDELLEQAMQYSKARTKRALVEEALRTFVDLKSREQRRLSYAERLEALRARSASIRLNKSVVDILRDDRNRR
ncbi:MAG TPA: type II toxin-antitoxin system VapB family antitoxin [Thermoanaerobaculia bacterium]|nr:type II toxin-antitoxin system VapB family antitoxin [Thermoanaerobaculia bacterium]